MVFGTEESEWDDVYLYVWVILGPLHFGIFVINDSPACHPIQKHSNDDTNAYASLILMQ